MSQFTVRASGRVRGARGRRERGYPTICREQAPSLTPRPSYCRLQAWHEGEHVSSQGAWDAGDRGLRERAKPPKPRKS